MDIGWADSIATVKNRERSQSLEIEGIGFES